METIATKNFKLQGSEMVSHIANRCTGSKSAAADDAEIVRPCSGVNTGNEIEHKGRTSPEIYRFAMEYGASLVIGWTILLFCA